MKHSVVLGVGCMVLAVFFFARPAGAQTLQPVKGSSAISAASGSAVAIQMKSGDEVVAARLARRWWVIVAAVVVTVAIAFVYLIVATPIYTATFVLAPDQRLGAGGGAGNIPPDEFLAAQRELILSSPVLNAALASLD